MRHTSNRKKRLLEHNFRFYGYLVGVAVLLTGTVVFLIGFVCPYWYTTVTLDGRAQGGGLWLLCDQGTMLTGCRETVINAAGWLRGVQFMQIMALLLMVAACACAGIFNYRLKPLRSRLLELLSGCAGIFALFSVTHFVARLGVPPDTTDPVYFAWAFWVDLAGSIMCVVAAVLIAIFNDPGPYPTWHEFRRKWNKRQSRSRNSTLEMYQRQKTFTHQIADNPNMWLVPADLVYT